jgi:hypothetical protein
MNRVISADPLFISVAEASRMIGRDEAVVLELWRCGRLRIVQMSARSKLLVVFESVKAFCADDHKAPNPELGIALPKHEYLHMMADKADTNSVCYFIGGGNGPVKIGHSADPEARMLSFQTGHPYKLKILATRDGGVSRERAYHSQFAKHHLRGEWFERCPEILAEIERLNVTPNDRA